MCDACVINRTKSRMLNRRNVMGAALGAAVTAPVASLANTPTHVPHAEIVDLTHTLSEDFPTFYGQPQYERTQLFHFEKDYVNVSNLSINEHTGTHVDAPLHFSQDGLSVDEIPVSSLIAPLCIIDISQRAQDDADASVTPDDINAWIARHGNIPDGACVAMRSGWGRRVGTESFRNFDGTMPHFPAFHPEAAAQLLETTQAASIAVDTLSLDLGISQSFDVHYAWLGGGRFGIECLAHLEALPEAGAQVFIGAPKYKGGSGGPARVVAFW